MKEKEPFYEVRSAEGVLEDKSWNLMKERSGQKWESVICGQCKRPCICDGFEVGVLTRRLYEHGGGYSGPIFPFLTVKTKKSALRLAAQVRAWLRSLSSEERETIHKGGEAASALLVPFANTLGFRHPRGMSLRHVLSKTSNKTPAYDTTGGGD